MLARRLLLLLVVFASSTVLAVQTGKLSVSGAWSGTLTVKGGGEAHEDYIHLVLKQDDANLTGTAGPDADRQYPIRKGKAVITADGVAISFEVIVNGEHMAFELKLDNLNGGRVNLKGNARIEGEDGQPHTASVELKPAKQGGHALGTLARMESCLSPSTTAA